jgi:hypothetical protein
MPRNARHARLFPLVTFVAVLLTVAPAAVAAIHAYWAAGGLWPGKTERELVDTVIGIPRCTRMPSPWASASVAVMLAGVAAWPLALAPVAARVVGPALSTAATLVVAAVFLGRGAVGYVPRWGQRHSAQPFATYDRLFYSPLCLALGAGFIALAVGGAAT